MAVTLNPADPSNFTQDGGQSFTAGATLTLTDSSVADFIAFFAADADANAGVEVDVVATFQVTSTVPVNADVGNRIVVNDGQSHAAIAACVIVNGVKGIGLQGAGSISDPATYPVFVAADWQAAPVTVRLRRAANGDAELIEINGVAPSPRALLAAASLAGPTRAGFGSFEFGCGSAEAQCTVAYSAYASQTVVMPISGSINPTRFRVLDSDSSDRVRLRADYTLGMGSSGIDPSTQPVTVRLSTPSGGQFYPAPDFNPLNGFDVQGQVGKRRWKLNDAERARTGIEQLAFDEDPNNGGGLVLRDFKTNVVSGDFSTVNIEITIGTGSTANDLKGTAKLVQKPPGSGKWRLSTE